MTALHGAGDEPIALRRVSSRSPVLWPGARSNPDGTDTEQEHAGNCGQDDIKGGGRFICFA